MQSCWRYLWKCSGYAGEAFPIHVVLWYSGLAEKGSFSLRCQLNFAYLLTCRIKVLTPLASQGRMCCQLVFAFKPSFMGGGKKSVQSINE